MKLYIEELKRLKKNKLLWIVILVYTLYNLISIFRYQYSALEVSDGLDPTRQILFLCPQIFILYLVTGYEFLSEQYRAGINESVAATAGGCTGRNVFAGFMVMAVGKASAEKNDFIWMENRPKIREDKVKLSNLEALLTWCEQHNIGWQYEKEA